MIKGKPRIVLKMCAIKESQPLEIWIGCMKVVEVWSNSVGRQSHCADKSEW